MPKQPLLQAARAWGAKQVSTKTMRSDRLNVCDILMAFLSGWFVF